MERTHNKALHQTAITLRFIAVRCAWSLCEQGSYYMAIIVAGKLFIKAGYRDEFIKKSCDSIIQARKFEVCEDFSVSPDPIDKNRVNIFEKWKSKETLNKFRKSGEEEHFFNLIEFFDVDEYEVSK